MSVENESWGPAQGEIQRRNTSAGKKKMEERLGRIGRRKK